MEFPGEKRKVGVKVGEEHCFEGGKVWLLTSHFL
jgi:hypothetical protein